MNSLTLIFTAACLFAIAYRFYGLFLANRVMNLRSERQTPAVTCADGHDYVPTNKYVLFGHHFAAIAAAGPLLGPVLAAQFGFLPGALWILIGAVLAGGVHDMVVLFASVRHKGKSLSVIAESEIGAVAGKVAAVAIVFILILTLAGLCIAVVNALFNSPWGTFTVFATMPIAMIMGIYMQKIRPGDITGGSIIGVVLLALSIYAGPYVAADPTLAAMFTFSKKQLALILPAYGFAASTLPVWFLLVPRDYLSTYLKIGTISALAQRLDSRHHPDQRPVHLRLGLPGLYRRHFHHLAAVRHEQPVAGHLCPDRRHDHADQDRQGTVRLGHRRPRPAHAADLHVGRLSQHHPELPAQGAVPPVEPVRHPDGADDGRLYGSVPALVRLAAD